MLCTMAKRNESPPSRPSTFGINLRRLREAAGLSQAELALKSKVGRISISNTETGVVQSPGKTAAALADALGVTVAEMWAPPDSEGAAKPVSGLGGKISVGEFLERYGEDLTDREKRWLLGARDRAGSGAGGLLGTVEDWKALIAGLRKDFTSL